MYAISADATELAVEVEEFYKTIDSKKLICINNAERNYVEETTSTYENLNLCLAGKDIPQSTSGRTSELTSTTYTTTIKPTTENTTQWLLSR